MFTKQFFKQKGTICLMTYFKDFGGGLVIQELFGGSL